MKFSREQQTFIDERRRHVVAAAIPGAGKTCTVVQKIKAILVDGSSFIAVTYTREAADALKEKTFAVVPVEWHGRCRIGTFHSLALRALENIKNSPVRGRKLMDKGKTREQRTIALEDAHLEPTAERLAWFEVAYSHVDDPFGLMEAERLSLDDPRRDDEIALAELRRKVVNGYEEGLKTNRLMDMSRVLLTALEFVQAGYRLFDAEHLLVDEFQDVDPVQLRLIIQLSKSMRVDVVGDDDQSVYRFRCGMGYLAFQEIQKALKPRWLTFTCNYRCKPEILHWAGLVISQNVHRYQKTLTADREPGGELKLIELDGQGQENMLVAQMVSWAVARGAKSVAVIARNNRPLVEIQPALTPLVEFRRVSCSSMWEETPCSTVVALLECLAEPEDEVVGLEHALHLFGAHGSEITLMRDAAKGRPVMEAFATLRGLDVISDDCRAAMDRLSSLLRRVGYPCRPTTSEAAHAALLEVFTEVLDALYFCGNFTEKQRAAYIHMLEAAEKVLMGFRGTLAQRLNVIRRSVENKDSEGIKVTLTTMHSAKGLEFDEVFIIRAAEEVLLGHARSPEDVEEERRLLYVAMTRARDALTITSARRYGHSRWTKATYMTSLLMVNGSPREDRFEDYAWMLRR